MNKMKKAIAALLVLICLFQSAFCAAFSDVDETTAQGKAIVKMAQKGLVLGTGDGCFHPNDNLTRSQFVKIINNMFGYTHIGENKFSDVQSGKWYYDDVCIASSAGYISGTGNDCFSPEAFVTRESACVIVNNILKMEIIPYYQEPSDFVSGWAKTAVSAVLSNRLISLDENGYLRATEPMTRGEACEMLEKCLLEDVGTVEKIDLSTIAREELEIRMNRVIAALSEKVIPETENENAKKVAQLIIENMRDYLKDSTHDYKKATEETFEIYKAIPKAEREVFKDLIQEHNKMEDLMLLYDFFYIE